MDKILVLEIAALGHRFLTDHIDSDTFAGLTFRPVQSVFPAVTCTVQSTMKTAAPASEHGMVGNGFFFRELARPMFWEQSSGLVKGARIWDAFRRSGKRVGQMFIQQSLGADSDILLSPAPIHKHHGGMIQDCFSRPAGLYEKLVKTIGRPFKLRHYWGPLASIGSSEWIVEATAETVHSEKPDLLFSYLPHLDYDLQRYGPSSEKAAKAFSRLAVLLKRLLDDVRNAGYRVLVYGDYAMAPVSRPVFPNRALRRAGLMAVRRIRRMAYPDMYSSAAFAVADHQIAHVILHDPSKTDAVKDVFSGLPGVDRILDADGKREMGIDHARAGDLVLIAEPDAWFAYPWWDDSAEMPDYATHIDIHNKPGYDPCELFFGRTPFSVSVDTSRIRGSHGRIGNGLDATWATDLDWDDSPGDIRAISEGLKRQLKRGSRG